MRFFSTVLVSSWYLGAFPTLVSSTKCLDGAGEDHMGSCRLVTSGKVLPKLEIQIQPALS